MREKRIFEIHHIDLEKKKLHYSWGDGGGDRLSARCGFKRLKLVESLHWNTTAKYMAEHCFTRAKKNVVGFLKINFGGWETVDGFWWCFLLKFGIVVQMQRWRLWFRCKDDVWRFCCASAKYFFTRERAREPRSQRLRYKEASVGRTSLGSGEKERAIKGGCERNEVVSSSFPARGWWTNNVGKDKALGEKGRRNSSRGRSRRNWSLRWDFWSRRIILSWT